MINRKEEQGQEAIDKIKKEVGDDAKIEWVPCDLGNLKEVKEVFTGIREREERLDLVRVQTPSISIDRQLIEAIGIANIIRWHKCQPIW
jgi:NAD(P)-dependent dehydrogenase (short-subunit alcohol dehydrogenase family)